MALRSATLLCIILLGCSTAKVKEPDFPPSIAPSWTRSQVHPLDPAQFPALLRDAHITKGWQTEYRASDGAVARVDVYATGYGAQGLDLVQRWRPERDNAQFYTEHFLINVAWQHAQHDELASLVRPLPKLLEGQ